MSTREAARRKPMNRRPRDILLRLLIAAALGIDAVVHLDLASGYQSGAPGGIGEGNLFRLEAAVAILVGLYVLIRGSRPAYAAAVVVAGSAFIAVLLYRYVDIPAIGPLPSMYEPVWFFEKTLSAAAEGLGAVLAAVGYVRQRASARRRR
ncbi:hypothetical protein [Arthrobacter bambusae]|uniref:hypothetical protein n=1 Tax=Arthrobacter bambusae TaxID=1338426 RepID=UPI00278B046F|nr:hypothetical protein [Arthrobacter bambusae]MDQ0211036.1 hypothetical protein [Arthrobacter bambusae]MDQ0237522.1 hypothetical protein [Arthrobacter bambusae]